MQTVDRRIIRTHKLLGQALIDLAIEKGYDQITIQDITDQADIGYRTFFRHFNTIDDLLLSIVENIFVEVERLLGMPTLDELHQSLAARDATRGRVLFQYVKENEKIFRVLLLERGSSYFVKPLIKFGKDQVKTTFANENPDPLQLDLASHLMITSTFALIRWWLENDMPYTPDEMGEIVFDMIAVPVTTKLMETAVNNNEY